MVVLTDSQPNSPVKSDQAWSSSQPTSPRAGPSAPRALPQGSVVYQPPPAYPSDAPLLPAPRRKPRPSVARRFFTALAIALLIWFGLSIFGHIIRELAIRAKSYEWKNAPRKEDGNILTCETSWSAPKETAKPDDTQLHAATFPVFSVSESFALPINSSQHYLIARGSSFAGTVVIRGEQDADPNLVKVDVTVRYPSQHALSRARVCKLEKPEGGVGVGIYTPNNPIEWRSSARDWLDFLVTVTVPISGDSVLDLNAFDTDLVNFRHKFEGLGNRVQFKHLSVKSTNGAIQADSLFVSQGTLRTTNGAIHGSYNATDSLDLQTSNSVIDVDVGLTNDDTHKASSLVLKTSNGRITARNSLLTTHNQRPQPKGGHFTVHTTSSNGRLETSFPATPVDSLLDFEGRTSNAAADVLLHEAYEGSFSVQTSSSSVDIDKEHSHDPTGRGRYRTIVVSRSGKTEAEGKVFWGPGKDRDEGTQLGRATVRTSNAWARLRL